MKIIDVMSQDRPTLSFEVFPPKTSATYQSVERPPGKSPPSAPPS